MFNVQRLEVITISLVTLLVRLKSFPRLKYGCEWIYNAPFSNVLKFQLEKEKKKKCILTWKLLFQQGTSAELRQCDGPHL